jgi:hypothetical protein
METTTEEQNVIASSFSNYYVFNPSNDQFLERHHFCVQLNQFHCYCYGNTKDGVRCIQFFQFVHIYPEGGGYDVYVEKEKRIVYVRDLISLRRDFFEFIDRTSLFRSSFLYDPEEKKLFRLHYLHLYLYLPTRSEGEWIGFIKLEKKKQILKKLKSQYQKIQKSIEGHPHL